MREWITTDSQNTPSNSEDEEIVNAPGNGGNVSVPEQVKLPNPWRKMMMMMMNFVDFSNCLIYPIEGDFRSH